MYMDTPSPNRTEEISDLHRFPNPYRTEIKFGLALAPAGSGFLLEPDGLAEVPERGVEVSFAVLDLPRQHGLSDLEEAGLLVGHDEICIIIIGSDRVGSGRIGSSRGKEG